MTAENYYIARNKSGMLHLFFAIPKKTGNIFVSCNSMLVPLRLDSRGYPYVTFENSPVEFVFVPASSIAPAVVPSKKQVDECVYPSHCPSCRNQCILSEYHNA